MEDISVFKDKNVIPDEKTLTKFTGKTFPLWTAIKDYVYAQYPNATEEWKYPGIKHGWSFRIKDKKRVIVYLLPRDKFFKVAFVFGQKATDTILKSRISDHIKKELKAATVYAEGRGIRIEVRDKGILSDIKSLIDIKLTN